MGALLGAATLVLIGPGLEIVGVAGEMGFRHSAVYVVLALAFFFRARARPSERGIWVALGVAQLATAAAALAWRYAFDEAPWSWGELLFALKYLSYWTGLALLLRLRVRDAAPRLSLDLTAATALATALGAAVLLPDIRAHSGLPTVGALVNIAYPAASFVIMLNPLMIAAMTGRRIGKQDQLIAAGLGVLAISDGFYALSLAGHTPTGEWASVANEFGWDLAPVLIAFGAWATPTPTGTPRPGHATEWLPTALLAGLSSGLLLYGLQWPINDWAAGLAIVALTLSAVRGLLMTRDTRKLAIFRYEALTDDLTELPNRRALFRELTTLAGERGENGVRADLIFFGLDGFRALNDTLGHDAGDEFLVAVAERLRPLADRHLLASLGSDEFAVLTYEPTMTGHLISDIRAAFDEPFSYGDVTVLLDVSVGIAGFPDDADNATELARRADVAMSDAKRRGLNVVAYPEARDEHTRDLLTMASELRGALAGDARTAGLWIALQPQIDLRDGACRSAETLVRWQHPRLGAISPAQLLPVAIRSRQMGALTEWVLDQSLEAVARLRQRSPEFRISVNVSAVTLVDVSFPGRIATALERHAVPPTNLVVEVTEDAVMSDPTRCLQVLDEIRTLGVELSIDDFGTGHSSLAQLRTLPANELKIDRAFIADLTQSELDADLVALVIALGKTSGMRVVAEGIETPEILVQLRGMGCDIGQGFGIGKPMPLAELETFLRA